MSASLVGSEMCIRDRASAGRVGVILRAESSGGDGMGRQARRRRFLGGSGGAEPPGKIYMKKR
eukprot:869052-Alexandrium_andersonii.AAC.1